MVSYACRNQAELFSVSLAPNLTEVIGYVLRLEGSPDGIMQSALNSLDEGRLAVGTATEPRASPSIQQEWIGQPVAARVGRVHDRRMRRVGPHTVVQQGANDQKHVAVLSIL